MVAFLLVYSVGLACWEEISLITGNMQGSTTLVYYKKVPLMAWVFFILTLSRIGSDEGGSTCYTFCL